MLEQERQEDKRYIFVYFIVLQISDMYRMHLTAYVSRYIHYQHLEPEYNKKYIKEQKGLIRHTSSKVFSTKAFLSGIAPLCVSVWMRHTAVSP